MTVLKLVLEQQSRHVKAPNWTLLGSGTTVSPCEGHELDLVVRGYFFNVSENSIIDVESSSPTPSVDMTTLPMTVNLLSATIISFTIRYNFWCCTK
jgi:hypothetical protein